MGFGSISAIVSFLRRRFALCAAMTKLPTSYNITGVKHEAYWLITTFCGSPNVDGAQDCGHESSQRGYRIPLHEFTKHALLGSILF